MARFNHETVGEAIVYYQNEMQRLSDRSYYYHNEMMRDILEAINEVLDGVDDIASARNDDELVQAMYMLLLDEPMVTGVGGCVKSNAEARKCVEDNLDVIMEMIEYYEMIGNNGFRSEFLDHIVENDFEWVDTRIRCYLLEDAVRFAVKMLNSTNAIIY